MTDFTITISNAIQLLGAADTENWGTLVWGTDNWATDDDLEFSVDKLIEDTANIAVGVSSDFIKDTIPNSLLVSGGLTGLTLSDAAGYSYVFPSNTNNAINIAETEYTPVSTPGDSFTTFPINNTTWGEV